MELKSTPAQMDKLKSDCKVKTNKQMNKQNKQTKQTISGIKKYGK